MNVMFLTLPDDPADLPAWLDDHLFDPSLPQLVAELRVLHGRPGSPTQLADVLGANADRVLDHGLAYLPRPALSQLLRQPELLIELRDLAITAGGPYWDHVGTDTELRAIADRVTDRVKRTIATDSPVPSRGRSRGWTHAITTLATAAAVLVAVYLSDGFRDRPVPAPTATSEFRDQPSPAPTATSGWGFARVNELPADADDRAVLDRLAVLAGEWSKKRPDTPVALAERLTEFRAGCAAIQLSELGLSPDTARWLKARCADWSAEIDGHLRSLEATHDVAAVRSATDVTVAGIVAELQARG